MRETRKAAAAFELFSHIPRDVRSVDEMARRHPDYALSSIRVWHARHRWRDRAAAADDAADAAEQVGRRQARRDLAASREHERLETARLRRIMAVRYLTTEDGTPRPMADLDGRTMEIAARFMRDADESERADLSDVAPEKENQELTQPIVILEVGAVERLRGMVDALKDTAPPPALSPPEPPADIVDADYVLSGGGP